MKSYLIPTSQARHLIKGISRKNSKFEVIIPDLNRESKRKFPDKETYMKIAKAKNVNGKKVVVLHSGAPKPNEGLIELELILQILKDNKAKPIEVFFTYFPYSMQDSVFEKGETNVAENLVEKLINYYKVRKIHIIDPHFWGRSWVRKYPLDNISATHILIKEAKKASGENILFFSPDAGGERRTKISGFKKKRLNSFQVKMSVSKINFKGRVVCVVDDMIKTGGTLVKFQELAKKGGAKKVVALITHGVMPSGVTKIKQKYSNLYLTNTIKQKEANIDITELILKTI